VSKFEPCLVELETLADQLVSAGHCKLAPPPTHFSGPFDKLRLQSLQGSLLAVSFAESPQAVHVYPSHRQTDLDEVQAQLAVDYANCQDDPELSMTKDEANVCRFR